MRDFTPRNRGDAVPTGHDGPPIRLMIVDDSIVARSILARMLEPLPEFEIVASVAGAEQALKRLDEARVDIILLDVAMPGTDGITALPEIIRRSHGARVLIVSSRADEGAAACLAALALGAADTLPKPCAGAGGFGGAFAKLLVAKLLRIARDDPGTVSVGGVASVPPAAEIVVRPVGGAGPIDCLAIGASTGGIHALNAFLAALPPSFTAPILVTQHLPPSFMPYFAAQLRGVANRPAHVATDGMRLCPGELLVAPGTAHLGLVRSLGGVRVQLEYQPAPSACLPSVDPMLEAVARCFRGRGVGVVLSGMGRDGALGAAALASVGGEVIAQDQASSVIWGMPGAVATAGLATLVGPPAQLARHVAQRAALASLGSPRWR